LAAGDGCCLGEVSEIAIAIALCPSRQMAKVELIAYRKVSLN
jgi:hypothetical protein